LLGNGHPGSRYFKFCGSCAIQTQIPALRPSRIPYKGVHGPGKDPWLCPLCGSAARPTGRLRSRPLRDPGPCPLTGDPQAPWGSSSMLKPYVLSIQLACNTTVQLSILRDIDLPVFLRWFRNHCQGKIWILMLKKMMQLAASVSSLL